MISAVAACAVLVGGIGTTGVLLRKQDKNKPASETENVVETTTEAAVTEIVCPFGDFTTRDFIFTNDDSNHGNYSKEAYAKLAEYLNTFNWGEKLETIDTSNSDIICKISWDDEINDRHVIDIRDNGAVFYTVYRSYPDGNEDVFEKGIYKIDYNKFDSETKAILAACIYDNTISEQDIANLVEVNLESAKLFDSNNCEIIYDAEKKARVTEFLVKKKKKMLKYSKPDLNANSSLLNAVEHIFNVDENTKRRQTYYIYINGFVNRCEYTTDENGEWQPSDVQNYSIDVGDFTSKLYAVVNNELSEKTTENKEEKKIEEEPKTKEQPQTPPEEKGQDMSHVDPPKTSPEDLYDRSAYSNLSDYAYLSPLPHVGITDYYDNIIALSDDNNLQRFEDFIKKQFEPLISVRSYDSPVDTDIDTDTDIENSYCIYRVYKSDTGVSTRDGYYIHGNGYASVCYYTFEDGEWNPAGCDNLYIDIVKFKELLNELVKDTK